MSIDLVGARIEEGSRFIARRRGYSCRGNNPDAYDATAARVNVTRILKSHLRISGVETSRVLVWSALCFLRENFPQRPLAVAGWLGSVFFRASHRSSTLRLP